MGFNIYHLIFGDKSGRVLCLHIWNQSPEILEDHEVFGLDLSASAKLVIWITNTRVLLRSRPNLGFDLS